MVMIDERDYEADYYEERAKHDDFQVEASLEDERIKGEHDAAMGEMQAQMYDLTRFTDAEIIAEYNRRFEVKQ